MGSDLVVRLRSLPVLLGRTTKALVKNPLRGMIFVYLFAVRIELMVAKAERDLAFFPINLNDLGGHAVLKLELLFKFGLRLNAGLTNVDQPFDSAIQFNENSKISDLADFAGD